MELRNINDTLKDYETFKPMHETLYYSDLDLDSSKKFSRKPFITDYDSFTKELGKSNYFFVVLDENNIGYIILDAFLSGVCQIKEMYIIPEYQRKGYGKSALNYLINSLKEDDSLTELKVISATMSTDRFYEKCGFSHIRNDVYSLPLK